MRLSSLALFVIPLAACGGALPPAQAHTGFASLSQALTLASANAQSSVTSAGGSTGTTSASGTTYQVNFSGNCLGGGTVKLAGTLDVASANSSGSMATFNYTSTFNACSENGVVINGSLAFALNEASTQTGATVNLTYSGTVAFTGQVSGDCAMDLTANISASDAASAPGASGSYSGTICGQQANAVFSAS